VRSAAQNLPLGIKDHNNLNLGHGCVIVPPPITSLIFKAKGKSFSAKHRTQK